VSADARTDVRSDARMTLRTTVWMCAAHVLSMSAFSAYPALLPRLQAEWQMSNAEAGLVSGALFAGYMACVPLLTSLTDRIDARRIYMVASLAGAAGALGFALFAGGVVMAALCQLLVGAGVAGTYMPGLKALTDTVGTSNSRPVAYYTAVFGVGIALSLVTAGFLADAFGWRIAVAATAIGPVLAGVVVIWIMPRRAPTAHAATSSMGAGFRRVFANRATRPYILGYAVHCWELFGSRSWLVAFLSFAQGGAAWALSPVSIAAIANLFAPPASVVGNELSIRSGRGRVIRIFMAASGALTCAIGLMAGLPWLVLMVVVFVHMALVNGDSSSLTAGVVAAAEPGLRGTTMAVHSTFGFATGILAPLVFGAALDWAGGESRPLAWMTGFITLGAGAVIAAALLRPGARTTQA
jgi:MFS family permease